MAARDYFKVGARVCLASDSARRGVVETHVSGGFWFVRFADKSRNIHIKYLEVLPSDDAAFEPSQAPLSWAEKHQENPATITAARGVQVGARVCLASDSAWRGVVESHASKGYWTVQFTDKSRNIRVNNLEVLPSDDATFEPSQAPPSGKEKQREAQVTAMAARGVQVGARVCLVSDSARRGVVVSHVSGGHWAVRFADTSRNIRLKDLEVLPSDDDTFESSQAPPSWREKQREERATTISERALQVGARVCLATTRRGAASSSHKSLEAAGPCSSPTRTATFTSRTSWCCRPTTTRSSRRKLRRPRWRDIQRPVPCIGRLKERLHRLPHRAANAAPRPLTTRATPPPRPLMTARSSATVLRTTSRE
ncbi:hypothetical protein M885DRAFT_301846 [Pelagophyceae sp. CCMP2097]|nr:hypothetical protein M885DRAFT_301846 [Pelagophyceae sp. CCMP2097]